MQIESRTAALRTPIPHRGWTALMLGVGLASWAQAFSLPPADSTQTNALQFSASGQYVEIGSPADFNVTSDFTMEAWVKLTGTTTGDRALIAKGDAWQLVLLKGTSPRIRFTTKNGNAVDNLDLTAQFPLNEWHHVATVFQGGTKRIYTNGILAATRSGLPGTVNVSALPVTFGASLQTPSQYLTAARLEEVRLWSRARTQIEIRADVGRQLLENASGLLGEWRFDETNGVRIADSSAGHRDGAMVNMTDVNRVRGIDFRPAPPEAFLTKSALRFQGDDRQYVAVQPRFLDAFRQTHALTVEAWINIAAFDPPAQTIVAMGGSWSLGVYPNSQKLTFQTITETNLTRTTNDLRTALELLPGRWYHVAATFDQGMKRLILDGDETVNNTVPGTLAVTNLPLWIGAHPVNRASGFHGDVDNVRLWSAARSLAELEEVKDVAMRGTESGLLADWRFDEGEGLVAMDSSFHERHADLVNLSDTLNRVDGLLFLPPDAAHRTGGVNALVFAPQSLPQTLGSSAEFAFADALTLEAWVRRGTWVTPGESIVAKGSSWGLSRHASTDQLKFSVSAGAATHQLLTTNALAADTWTHVAATFDGTALRLFVNGALNAQTNLSVPTTLNPGTSDVVVGSNWSGAIDDLRIWSVARSDDEIAGSRDWQVPAGTAGLVVSKSLHGRVEIGRATPIPVTLPTESESEYDVTTSLTLEAWVNIDAASQPGEAILTKGDAWGLYRSAQGRKIVFRTRHDDGTTHELENFSVLELGQWYHVAATFDDSGDLKHIFLNGNFEASAAVSRPLAVNDTPVILGGLHGTPDSDFRGRLGRISIWNRVRDIAEMVAAYRLDELGSDSGLLNLTDLMGRVESEFDFADAFTLEAWVKVDAWTKPWQAIVTKGEAWGITREAESDRIVFRTQLPSGPADLSSATSLRTGEWHHVAAVFKEGKKRLYLDGVLNASGSIEGELEQNNVPLALGGHAEAANRGFYGRLNHVRLWSLARSDLEILESYERAVRGNETGLVSVWALTRDLQDEAAGDRDGTWSGGGGGAAFAPGGVLLRPVSPGNLALSFNAALQQHVLVTGGDAFAMPMGVTVEFWVHLDVLPPGPVGLVSKGTNDWAVTLENTGQIRSWPSGSVSSSVLPLQQWTHVAVVTRPTTGADPGTNVIYFNGVRDSFGANQAASQNVNAAGLLVLGAELVQNGDNFTPDAFFTGSLDEVRLWAGVFDDPQIQERFLRQANGDEARLVAVWSMDQLAGHVVLNGSLTEGSALDGIYTQNDGAPLLTIYVEGVPLQDPLPGRSALYFDGHTDFLKVPDPLGNLNFGETATFEAWILPQPALAVGWRTILYKGDSGYGLAIDANNYLRFFVDGLIQNALSSARPVRDGAWQHVAVVVNTTSRRTSFFIDGQPAGSVGTAVLRNNGGPLFLGRKGMPTTAAEGGHYFHGYLDEVRMWKTARSNLEVEYLAFQELPLQGADLAAHWTFNEGGGTIAHDSSLNHLNATLGRMDQAWARAQTWPVAALDEGLVLNLDPDYHGLWIGEVTLNAVNEVHPNAGANVRRPTTTDDNADLRLILHVDAQGRARLLKDVMIMATRAQGGTNIQEVLVTNPSLLPQLQGVVERGGKKVGLRHGSVAFDFPGLDLPLLGGVGAGVGCVGLINLPADHPTNPFKHRYHPEHRSGFDITRRFSLQFDRDDLGNLSGPRPGYGVDHLTGLYRETVTGLHKVPLIVEGFVSLTRISETAVLNNSF